MSKRDQEPEGTTHDYDLTELLEVAAQGRRLAIYDRATNLYAYWYLQLRAVEEISRSRRHGKGVVCLSVWAPAPDDITAMSKRLQESLRDHDLAAYLNNGHFVVLLTETDAAGAGIVVGRLLAGAPTVTGGIACFPDDGATFEDLLECAKSRAGASGIENVA